MKTRSIMTKSQFMTRRKVILYIIATILILGVVSGFTNQFITDNTRVAAPYGMTYVTEQDIAQATGTPEDYDLITNLRFAAYKLHHAAYFRAETYGDTVADIGYTQIVRNTRVGSSIAGVNTLFTETVSTSSLVKSVEQTYSENGIIICRPGSYSNGKASFSNSAYSMSYSTFSKKYGAIPNQLSKYVIGTPKDNSDDPVDGIDKNTIISVSDNNAKAANVGPNAISEREGVDYYIPETLVANGDGLYVFTLKLDPLRSAVLYRNEVRTRGGADQNPAFKAVTLTVTIDREWNPVSVKTYENYDIAIPVLGAMGATGNLTETFSMINEESAEIPERTFFQPYVDRVKNDPDYVPVERPDEEDTSAVGYLTAAFGDYLNGSKKLALDVWATSDYVNIDNLTLSLGLGEDITADVLLGDLYVKYADGKINLKVNDINGYMKISDFAALAGNADLKSLLGGKAFDALRGEDGLNTDGLLDKLFGGSILDKIFENCEMTTANGVTEINFPFDLDLSAFGINKKITVDPSIFIKEDGKALRSITGDIIIGETVISVTARPCRRSPSFPSVAGAVDLSGLSGFVQDALATAAQTVYGLSGSVTVQGTEIGIDAYIDRTEGLKADAVISALGLDITVKVCGENAYVGLGNIDVRGKAEELPALLSALLNVVDLSDTLKLIKGFLPETVEEYAAMLQKLEVKKDSVDIGLNFARLAPINISLKRGGGKLTGLAFDAAVSLSGIALDASADLNITSPEKRGVAIPAGSKYLTFAELTALINDAAPYLTANNNLEVALSGSAAGIDLKGKLNIDKLLNKSNSVENIAAGGDISVLGQNVRFSYINDIVYAALGEIRLKLDTNKLDELKASGKNLMDSLAADSDGLISSLVNAVGAVYSDNGALVAEISLGNSAAVARIDLKKGSVTVTGEALDIALDITTVKKSHALKAPENADSYADCAGLNAAIDKIADIIINKGVSGSAVIAYGDMSFTAAFDASVDGSIELDLNEPTLGLNITYKNDRLYVSLGAIRLSGELKDIKDIEKALEGANVKLDGLLEKLKSALDFEDIAAKAVGAIKSFAVDGDTLVITVGSDSLTAKITARTDLSCLTAAINTGVNDIKATVNLSGKPAAVKLPTGSFTPLSELAALVSPALEYISDGYTISLGGDITLGGENITINGNVKLDVTAPVKAAATLQALGQTVKVNYANDALYVSLGNIKLKLARSDFGAFGSAANKVLGAAGISGAVTVDKLVTAAVPVLPDAVSYITSFSIKDGVVTLGLGGSAEIPDILVTADVAKANVCAAGSIKNVAVELNASLSAVKPAVPVISELDAAAYSDIAPLAGTISAVAPFITSEGLKATLNLNGSSFGIAASFSDGIRAAVRDASNSIPVIAVEADGSDIYATCASLGIKLSLNDIKPAVNAVKPLLAALGVPDSVTDLISDLPSLNTALDIALTAVKSLSISDGLISLYIEYAGTAVKAELATDLSELSVSLGEGSDKTVITFSGIAPSAEALPSPDRTACATLSDIIELISEVAPLANNKAFELGLDVALFGQSVSGTLYLDFTSGAVIELELDVAGIALKITVKDGTLYINVGTEDSKSNILISEPLTLEGLKSLIIELDKVIPGIKATAKAALDFIMSLTASKLINAVSLAPTADGFTLGITLSLEKIAAAEGGLKFNGTDVDIAVTYAREANTRPAALGIDCDILGIDVSLKLNAAVNDGVLTALSATEFTVSGVAFEKLDITVSPTAPREVRVRSGFVTVTDIVKYIEPVLEIVKDANGVNYITLDLSALALFGEASDTQITGSAQLALIPAYDGSGNQTGTRIAAEINLKLFAGTGEGSETDVKIIFTDNKLYISSGKIKLALDTDEDFIRLYDILEQYLPDYINLELAKLFGVPSATGTSAFNSVALLIDRLQSIIDAATDSSKTASEKADAIIDLLFAPMETVQGYSFIRTVSDLIGISKTGDDLTLSVSILNITVNITPELRKGANADGSEYRYIPGITVSTELFGVTLRLSITNYKLNAIVKTDASGATSPDTAKLAATITAPSDRIKYVSIIDFVEAIRNAANTLTAKTSPIIDENGNVEYAGGDIAFEVKSFAFDYDMFEYLVDYRRDENDKLIFPEGTKLTKSGSYYYAADSKGNEVKPLAKTNDDGSVKYVLDDAGRIAIQPKYDKLTVKDVTYAKRNANGELILTDTGSDVSKEVENHIEISNIAGKSALKFGLIRFEYADIDGNTKSKKGLNVEAHINLYMSSLKQSTSKTNPMAIDLYVVNDAAHPDGLAFIDYREGGNSHNDSGVPNSERIFIDYVSVLQIVAAVMDIVGAEDSTVQSLLGDYRLQIDTSVFDSMAIAGLDKVKTILDGLAIAIDDIISAEENNEGALYYIGKAWDSFKQAGSIEGLRELIAPIEKNGVKEDGELIRYVKKALEKLMHAKNAFGSNKPAQPVGRSAELFINDKYKGSLVQKVDGLDSARALEYNSDTTYSFKKGDILTFTMDGEKLVSLSRDVGCDALVPAQSSNAIIIDKDGDYSVSLVMYKDNAAAGDYSVWVGNHKTAVNGKLFNDIVNGIRFEKMSETTGDGNVLTVTDTLKATIDNTVTTQTAGTSNVTVIQKDSIIDTISVEGLDVNTNLLRNFNAQFTAGEKPVFEYSDSLKTDPQNGKYSDFGNIKHLLFDVMNTANMLEFEIGSSSDKIDISMLGIDISIGFSAKVKIIDQGEGAEPRYKTAADIQLNIPAVIAALPECVTRLFFYDDVIYVHGVKSWSKKILGGYDIEWIDMMFTVSELGDTIANNVDGFVKEFIFRLIPLRQSLLGMDIHQKIIDAMKEDKPADPKLHTIAQIFKSYSYDKASGKHSATIGLQELALDTRLSDVNVSLIGANDSDDNILDNYIATAHIDTKMISIVSLNLSATLINVSTPTVYYTDGKFTQKTANNTQSDYGRKELRSTGFTPTTIDKVAYTIDGKSSNDGKQKASIIDQILPAITFDKNGKIIESSDTHTSANGTAWTHIWKS